MISDWHLIALNLEAYIREFSKTGGIYHEEVALLAIHSSADVWIGLLTAEGQSTE